MELPKNITQIGETNPHCKIYVEDYVISYMKQLNQTARNKSLAVAVYGVRKEENDVVYLFLYGACKLSFLQRESRHLSQAVLQEVEKQRRKYFSETDFLGYCLLDGEMTEGFHVCEQGVCRYIEGYAQFYERNDRMLAFMLEERKVDAEPEKVDEEKYETVKKRQEERRVLAEEKGGQVVNRQARTPASQARTSAKEVSAKSSGSLRAMKTAAAAVFLILCVTGLMMMGNGETIGEIRMAAGRLMEAMTEKQLPDAEAVNTSGQAGTVVTEDKLTDALIKENEGSESGPETNGETVLIPTATPAAEHTPVPTAEPTAVPTAEPTAAPTAAPTAVPTEAPTPEPTPASYTVKQGDTLIGICIAKYGSDAKVAEICKLNEINEPDDIKVGDKILLP